MQPPGWNENGSWLLPAWLVVPKAGVAGLGVETLSVIGTPLVVDHARDSKANSVRLSPPPGAALARRDRTATHWAASGET